MCFQNLSTSHLEDYELISLLSSQRESSFPYPFSCGHAITATTFFLQQLLLVPFFFFFFFKWGKWSINTLGELSKVTQLRKRHKKLQNPRLSGFNIVEFSIPWCKWKFVFLLKLTREIEIFFIPQLEKDCIPVAKLDGVTLSYTHRNSLWLYVTWVSYPP